MFSNTFGLRNDEAKVVKDSYKNEKLHNYN
jgi:hypothetical protein